jgi:NADPH-dependent 2,4-dienoyl-CoA reductase/sulfur reductase-like enzyme
MEIKDDNEDISKHTIELPADLVLLGTGVVPNTV